MNSKHKRKSDRTGKHAHLLYGSICGFLNGLFGSGGGTVAVPAFEKNGTEPKKAHASSVALIFVLSLVTAVIYLMNGKLDFATALSKIQEYLKMFPDDENASKELIFLQSRNGG